LRKLSPSAAFVAILPIVTVVVSAGVVSSLIAVSDFVVYFYAFVFVALFTAPIVLLSGLVVGIPTLRGLKRLNLDHRSDALAISGLVAGTVPPMLFNLFTGGSPFQEPLLLLPGAAGGVLSGLLWWALANPNLNRSARG
jgi:hypothetical protein